MSKRIDEDSEYSEEELDAIWAEFEALGDPDFPEECQGCEDPELPRKNFTTQIQNDILTIAVDLRKVEGESRSGRSWVVASSGGNIPLFDQNGYRPEVLNFSISKRKEGTKPQRWYSVR